MRHCTQCGTAAAAEQAFCTRCGTLLGQQAEPPAAERDTMDGVEHVAVPSAPPEQPASWPSMPGEPGQAAAPAGARPPSRWRGGGAGVVIAISAAVLVLGGGGAAAWTVLGRGTVHHAASAHRGSAPPARPGSGGSSPAVPAATASQSAASASATLPATTQPVTTQSAGPGTVTIAPGAGQQADAQQVAGFLRTWFQAINARDYATYVSLYAPQLRPTPQQFRNGYESTRDSGAVLSSISATGAGLAAEVSFTSHQKPADSPSSTSCTSWDITLYLVPSGSSYEITHAPPGYHSRYQAC